MACLSSQDKYVTSWASDSGLFDPLTLGPGKPPWVQCHFHLGLIWMTCIHNLWCTKDGCSELHSAQIRPLTYLYYPHKPTLPGCIFALCNPYRGPVEWQSMNPVNWISAESHPQLHRALSGSTIEQSLAEQTWSLPYLPRVSERPLKS